MCVGGARTEFDGRMAWSMDPVHGPGFDGVRGPVGAIDRARVRGPKVRSGGGRNIDGNGVGDCARVAVGAVRIAA